MSADTLPNGLVLALGTTVAVSAYVAVIRPILARRALRARVEDLVADLDTETRLGVLPLDHPLVCSIQRHCANVLAAPDTAGHDYREALRGQWSFLLVQEFSNRLPVAQGLPPEAVVRLSHLWRALGAALVTYAVDGSALWPIRRLLPRPDLGRGLAGYLVPTCLLVDPLSVSVS